MSRFLWPTIGLVCLAALMAACFGEVIWGGHQFGFRDFAHFYYPLYQRVQMEWSAGRWPLWEPEENAGMPLLGNPTAAVLYPGKLIYALLPYAWAARGYVLAHQVLAVAAMVALMRSLGVSRAGSGLSGLAYGFGVPVLFQYCNVVFLVGAAWTPLGLRGADRWLRLGRRWGLVELALILTLEVLGGDPQAAYLTVLCAGVYAAGLAWARGGPGDRSDSWRGRLLLSAVVLVGTAVVLAVLARSVTGERIRGGVVLLAWALVGWIMLRGRRGSRAAVLRGGMLGLAAACVVAVALTAAQLIPVLEYTGLSSRATGEGAHDIYPFSLEPYRAVEWVWPNAFGMSFGVAHGWIEALMPAGEHKVWVPSLYLGGLSFVLALGAVGVRTGPSWRVGLTVLALLSFWAALGEFGSPLWWAREVPAWRGVLGDHDPTITLRRDGLPRDGDFSLYWLMATLLPGFSSFRFPSKLLTFTSLALAGLAGLGWDRATEGRSRRALILGAVFLGVTVVLLGATVAQKGRMVAALAVSPAARVPSLYGTFDPAGAVTDLQAGLLQGAVVLGLALPVIALARRGRRAAGAAALVLLTADLIGANARHVITIPQSVFEGTPRALAVLQAAERAIQHDRLGLDLYRVHRMTSWNPKAWETAAPDRNRELVAWERDTLKPKYGVPYGLQYTFTEGTAEIYDYQWFFSVTMVTADISDLVRRKSPGGRLIYYPRRGFDVWNTRYFLLPAQPLNDVMRGIWSLLPRTEPLFPDLGPGSEARDRWDEQEDWIVLRNLDALPRAWVVHSGKVLPPIVGLGRDDRQERMREVLYPGDEFWREPYRLTYDPRSFAWVEAADPAPLLPYLSAGPSDPTETVAITSYEPQRVELSVRLNRPGVVVLADIFYPGWHLTLDGSPAPILRTNRAMRGAAVDAGTHRLVFTYRPTSFRLGLGISAFGLVALLALGLWAGRSGRSLPLVTP